MRRQGSVCALVLSAFGLVTAVLMVPGGLGAQDVLPTPRGQLGGPAPLQLTPGPGGSGGGSDEAATGEAETAAAATCDVEPRSLASLLAAAATPEAEGREAGEESAPADVLDGELPDAGTVAGIRGTLEQLAACEAAGDELRVLALVSDAYLRELVAMRLAEADDAEAEQVLSGALSFVTIGGTVVRDEDLRVLEDGRVGAAVRLGEGAAEPARGGVGGEYVVFVEQDGRWLLDERRVIAEGTIVGTPETAIGGGAALPEPVAAAVRAAAVDLGVPAGELTVVRLERREWRDSSLGCPKPGEFYAQVITPGYLVVIAGVGREVEYHTDEGGNVVLCEG